MQCRTSKSSSPQKNQGAFKWVNQLHRSWSQNGPMTHICCAYFFECIRVLRRYTFIFFCIFLNIHASMLILENMHNILISQDQHVPLGFFNKGFFFVFTVTFVGALWGEWKNIDERSIDSTTSQALGFWSRRMGSASVAARWMLAVSNSANSLYH